MVAVILATCGVMAVIYGGASIQEGSDGPPEVSRAAPTVTTPLLGELMTLVASVGYGLYQVLYKKYLTLPLDSEHEEPPPPSYAPIPTMSSDDIDDVGALNVDITLRDPQSTPDTTVYPPPFGLHPNLLTSSAGILTLLFLWIPLPVLHYIGAEPFRWPANWHATMAVSGIALSGVVYNAGFMVIYPDHLFASLDVSRMFRSDSPGGVGSNHRIHRKSVDYCVDLRVGRRIWRRNQGSDILEFHGFRRDCFGLWDFGGRPRRQSVVKMVTQHPRPSIWRH